MSYVVHCSSAIRWGKNILVIASERSSNLASFGRSLATVCHSMPGYTQDVEELCQVAQIQVSTVLLAACNQKGIKGYKSHLTVTPLIKASQTHQCMPD